MIRKLTYKWRVIKYQCLSDTLLIDGDINTFHPILYSGAGSVSYGKNVQMGVVQAPGFWSTYAHIEARFTHSLIKIGHDVQFSNGVSIVCFSEIQIGSKTVIGEFCSIMDADGHDVQPDKRKEKGKVKPIYIGENVFIGAHVIILKGVRIGNHAVIGAGAVITKDVAENAVVAGSPQRMIKSLKS